MARNSNQKVKILYTMKYLMERTDCDHPASMHDLVANLERYGIEAERKSISDDMECLRLFGLDIEQIGSRGRGCGYYIANREFELPELKLLADSVQAARFISERKTRKLIKKLEQLTSDAEAAQLNRQVLFAQNYKTANESIYYNVDALHSAIAQNRRISFHYFNYNISHERVYRKGKALYEISPLTLWWNDENYYLIGFAHDTSEIRHYRVDKMADLCIMDLPREGLDEFQKQDMEHYIHRLFGMYRGEDALVTLRFSNSMAGVVIDRFGFDTVMRPDGEQHFLVTVPVVVSPQFFGWVFGLSNQVKILSPGSVVSQYKKHLNTALADYQ